MKTKLSALFAAVLIGGLAFAVTASAAAPSGFWSYPVIKGYGPVHVWPNVVSVPNKQVTYKAVFDVTKSSKSHDTLSRPLDHVARAVNVFAAAGVPLGHMKFVVIVHGPATNDILSDKAYQARFHVHNPNLAVISALRKAGVRILICGNALAEHELTPEDVDPQVKVALSALSTLVILENRGYALVRM